MPYGRGGAGNIQALEQENTKISGDHEANQQAARFDPLPAEYSEKEEQQYAHTGRGGAGNLYSPKDLSQSGHFSDAHRSHILGDGTQPPANSMEAVGGSQPPSYNAAQSSSSISSTRTYGRGGAGNWSFGVSEDEERAARKRMQEIEAKEKLEVDVENQVKESLAMPQKAKLSEKIKLPSADSDGA